LVCVKTCIYIIDLPLDLIKVRIQTMKVVPGKPPPFSGALDCFKQTLVQDGVRGMYRGVGPPLLGTLPVYAAVFWLDICFHEISFLILVSKIVF